MICLLMKIHFSNFNRLSQLLKSIVRGTRSRGGIEQLFDCHVNLNCQAIQPMGISIDWTVKDNVVTLMNRRKGHTLLCKQGRRRPTPVQRRL